MVERVQLKSKGAIATAGLVGVSLLIVGSYVSSHRQGIQARRARRVPEQIAESEGISAESPEQIKTEVVRVGNLQRRTLVLINKVARREATASG